MSKPRTRLTPPRVAPVKEAKAVNALANAYRQANAQMDLDTRERGPGKYFYPMKSATPPPGVLPEGHKPAELAMDSAGFGDYVAAGAGFGFNGSGVWQAFPGYPYLAQLTQLPEYRKMVSIIAEEMTRKWVKLRNTGDQDKTDKLKQLEEAMRRYKLREAFRHVAELDGYFGRGHLYPNLKMPGSTSQASEVPDELDKALILTKEKIKPKSLLGFITVEPMWTYPSQYNSTNPLSPDFYRPGAWYVMGKTVDASRLLTFVSRPVPDMLKAAYSFGGLSLSQIAQPYVDHWLRTRDSVSDTVHSFSINGLATNMQVLMSGLDLTGGDLINRALFFNKMRDNKGLMLVDKDTEEYFQFNVPLSGLDALQAQSQEQMASVSGIPLVKLLGIQPAGLNASSDGEIRVFYDHIHAQQESLFREPLKYSLDIIQLSEFGEIDADIDFEFEPLYQLSELEMATVQKTNAETSATLVTAAIISPEEARQPLINNPDSPFAALTEEAPDVQPAAVEEEGDSPEPADTKGTSAGKG
jgi:phage-related protein (TIGR01555 family)